MEAISNKLEKLELEEEVLSIAERIPPEIYEEIFQHLKVDDLLEASLVSKSWNGIIGKSKKCMEKITLNFEYRSLPESDQEVLLKSKRHYQNIVANGIRLDSFLERIFKQNEDNWTNVTLQYMEFDAKGDKLDNVLTYFAPTVKALEISGGTKFQKRNIDKILKMLQLRLLTLGMFDDVEFEDEPLSQNHTIDTLNIMKFSRDFSKTIQFLIQSLPSLKNLIINNLDDEFFRFLSSNASLKSIECWKAKVSPSLIMADDPIPAIEKFSASCFIHSQVERVQILVEPKNKFHSLYIDGLKNYNPSEESDYSDYDVYQHDDRYYSDFDSDYNPIYEGSSEYWALCRAGFD